MYSRFKAWNYALNEISNWLEQKKVKLNSRNWHIENSFTIGFMKYKQHKGSLTDSYIYAYQNFKEFRKWANEHKIISTKP